MKLRRARDTALQVMERLPPLPRPWDIDELCRRLAVGRGRPLNRHVISLPALPTGFWFDDGESDHIVHRPELTGYYRDHVVLHEICHILEHHSCLGDVRAAVYEEEVAEIFATGVLKVVKRAERIPVTSFERRFSVMSGAAV